MVLNYTSTCSSKHCILFVCSVSTFGSFFSRSHIGLVPRLVGNRPTFSNMPSQTNIILQPVSFNRGLAWHGTEM